MKNNNHLNTERLFRHHPKANIQQQGDLPPFEYQRSIWPLKKGILGAFHKLCNIVGSGEGGGVLRASIIFNA